MKPTILVAEDERATLEELAEILSEEGYEVIPARDGRKALEAFQRMQTDFVLTDVRMPGMDGIELLRKVKKINEKTKVIIVTGYGTEEMAVSALRAGASNYLKKPLDLGELLRTLDSLLALEHGLDLDVVSKRLLKEESRTLRFPSDPELVPGVVRNLACSLPLLFDLTTVERIEIALAEMIVNAIEHGNLEISFQEKAKAQEQGTFGALIRERMKGSRLRGRKVEVSYHLRPAGVEYLIKDEGSGFDWRTVMECTSAGDLLKESGRGIVLCKLFMDSIEYNEAGNEVRIVKYAMSVV